MKYTILLGCLFTFINCGSDCAKYKELVCENNADLCEQFDEKIKKMSDESCKNAIIGFESQKAIEDTNFNANFKEDDAK